MMILTNIPIEVYHRALDLYGVNREATIDAAHAALMSAEGRLSVHADFPGISPFAQAVAEYLSLSGPFSENDGEFAGVSGFRTT